MEIMWWGRWFKGVTSESAFSPIMKFKILYTRPSTLNKVSDLTVMMSKFKTWVYKCTLSKQVSFKNKVIYLIYYILTGLSVPLSDRDLVSIPTNHVVKMGKRTILCFKTFSFRFFTKRDRVENGLFRIEWEVVKVNSHTISIDTSSGRSTLEYIPSWLVQYVITKGPVDRCGSLKAWLRRIIYDFYSIVHSGLIWSSLTYKRWKILVSALFTT